MNNTVAKLLDKYPGLVVTGVLVAIIAVFLIVAQPWNVTKTPNQTAPNPSLESQGATLRGHVTAVCSDSQPQCQTDQILSAYDIAVYAAGRPETVVAQTPIDSFGDFSLALPPGNYVVQTIPANQAIAIDVTLQPGQTSTVNLTIK